jgi:uncharacterized repeat protein (TIGR03987 family)
MANMMILSSTLITLALVFYSVGVWSERISRYLKPWHVIAFWTGFLFDVSGTLAMHRLAKEPFDLLAPHTLTGQIALWLMLAHAVWSTRVSRKGSEEARAGFHRYSLFVWLFWLIPYSGGMFLGMRR